MGTVVDRMDSAQRRHPVVGVPIAVLYKFMDDQGNYLAAIITYYAFIAIFPLLLLASSIFGFILQGRPELQEQVLNSALSQFPIIGDQLGRPEGLQGSTAAVIVGALAAMYGSLGMGQAIQNAMNTAWSVPRNSRPNPFFLRVRSLVLLVTSGIAVLAVTVLSALSSSTDVLSRDAGTTLRLLIFVATVIVVGLMLTLLFRMATAHRHDFRAAVPGAFFVAFAWQGLQYVGTIYVTAVIAGTTAMNQTFGLVLGLIGIIYLASITGILGIQINVVIERHLWPRALMTLFTDKVSLTEADRRAYASYARAQRHKGWENVEVSFTDPATGEITLPEPDSRLPE